MKASVFIIVGSMCLVGCGKSNDATTTTTSSTPSPQVTETTTTTTETNAANPSATQPDNSGINVRDRAPDAQTAGMQGQGKSDVDLTAESRRQVVAQKMSVNAENAKIVTVNGKVTLRGPVASQTEKDNIGQIANSVAGAENVDNELDVQP